MRVYLSMLGKEVEAEPRHEDNCARCNGCLACMVNYRPNRPCRAPLVTYEDSGEHVWMVTPPHTYHFLLRYFPGITIGKDGNPKQLPDLLKRLAELRKHTLHPSNFGPEKNK